jgi:hypothetical protein
MRNSPKIAPADLPALEEGQEECYRSSELQQEGGFVASLQYQINTVVAESSTTVLVYFLICFGTLVAGCGCGLYFVGFRKFKDGTLFVSHGEDDISPADYFFAAMLLMLDPGLLVQAESKVARCVSFLVHLMGFGKHITAQMCTNISIDRTCV